MGKFADHAAQIAVYHDLGKQRPLTEDELSRLDWLVKAERNAAAQKRWREKPGNKEVKAAKDRKYQRTKRAKLKISEARKKRRKEYGGQAGAAASRAWREKNPEHASRLAEAHNERRRAVSAIEKGVKGYAARLELWQRIATERPLTSFEKCRVTSLKRLLDPNDSIHVTLRERRERKNKRRKEKEANKQ